MRPEIPTPVEGDDTYVDKDFIPFRLENKSEQTAGGRMNRVIAVSQGCQRHKKEANFVRIDSRGGCIAVRCLLFERVNSKLRKAKVRVFAVVIPRVDMNDFWQYEWFTKKL